MLAAAMLRLWNLHAQSLWIDEIFTWQTSSPLGPLTWADIIANLNSPIVSAFSHVWMKLAGQSEFALRLPMALASIALVPAVAQLARRVAGEEVFLPAAWLTALSPFVQWYGQEFRGYAFAFLFATLALLALLDVQERGRWKDLFLLALWMVLGALSNMSTLLLVPVLVGTLVLAPAPGRSRFLMPLVLLALLALALSPWIVHHLVRRLGWLEWDRLVPGRTASPDEIPLRGATTFSWMGIPFTFYVLSTGYALGPSLRDLHGGGATLHTLLPWAPGILASAVTFGLLAVVGLGALGDPRPPATRSRRWLVLAVILVPIVIVAWFALSNFKVYNPRYVAVGIPAWLCLIAAGLAALHGWARRVFWAAVLVLFAVSHVHQSFGARYAKDDFGRATRALALYVAPQDVIVAAGNFSPLEYYWRDREPVPVVYWVGYARDERMEPRFRALLNPAGPTWLVVSRTHDLDPTGRFEAWVRRTWPRSPAGAFPGVRIYRIEASTP